ncbi:MAG: hypothetical protein AUK47_07380 [Deltaproteobacteria bacterium CG2_30_63_29]|nr:MAG: hypothetical protein AUK47_07380 [Deltaproteobacteria bacterium CG2_30_63_29]PIV98823.1 MAG: hypothetical protein COW42_13035 [Deltaproteobacteria bacterium CG17_big_fil_post_rev_8_21_14_2_50_63_7]
MPPQATQLPSSTPKLNAKERLLEVAEPVWGFFPLSLAGLMAFSLGYAAFVFFGKAESDYVLYAAGLIAMGIVAVDLFFVFLGFLWLLFSIRHRADEQPLEGQLDAGTELATGFSLPTFVLWPFVEASMKWKQPHNVEVRLVSKGWRRRELITPTERGRIQEIRRTFKVHDIFGIASISFSKRWPAALRIAPQLSLLEAAIALRDTSGDGYSHPSGKEEGELIEMRRYSPGDPLRLVLWKTFARTRRLLVRKPERAIAPQRSTMAFLVAGRADEASASTARTFLERGLLGPEFTFSADGAHSTFKTPRESVEAIIDSAHYRHDGGKGLNILIADMDLAAPGNCILFVPSSLGDWFDRVADFSRRTPQPPTLIIGVDGVLHEAKATVARRVLRRSTTATQRLSSLPALYDKLASLGGPIHIVHRPSGKLIGPVDIDALRAL